MKPTLSILTGALVCSLSAPQISLAAAYYFESKSTTGNQVMNVHAWIDGPKAKIEFIDGGQMGFFGEGSYMVTSDAGQILYIVNPKEMTYSEMNLDQMLNMAGSVMEAVSGVVKMDFSDFTNEKLAEEPGGDILGYATTRYHYKTGYTMNMTVMGFKRSNRTDNEQEFWCTDEFDADGFSVWLRPDRMRTGNTEMDELIKQQYQNVDCLPLRSRTTATMTGERGRDTTTVTTMEVTMIREESSIPSATFELPSGYTETSLIPEMPDGFSVPDASGSDESQDQGGEQPRIRLRDLLRR
jgi:hypothetical protein